MTEDQKVKYLALEIGYYLTRLENHPEDGAERIGHCLGEMKLSGKNGERKAADLQSQIASLIEANAQHANG